MRRPKPVSSASPSSYVSCDLHCPNRPGERQLGLAEVPKAEEVLHSNINTCVCVSFWTVLFWCFGSVLQHIGTDFQLEGWPIHTQECRTLILYCIDVSIYTI